MKDDDIKIFDNENNLVTEIDISKHELKEGEHGPYWFEQFNIQLEENKQLEEELEDLKKQHKNLCQAHCDLIEIQKETEKENDRLRKLAELKEKYRWRDVEKEFPESDRVYVVQWDDGSTGCSYYSMGYRFMDDRIIYWRPLPEPKEADQ